jgi:hypothetical protein
MATEQKKVSMFDRFYRWFGRLTLVLTCGGFVFLFFTLLTVVSRLEAMAPAELRFLLEIVKNRFLR